MAMPVVSPMSPSDLDEIMILERQCFRDPWSRRMYHTDLTRNSLATYLVLRPGAAGPPPVLAYGGFWLIVGEAHIATIASHPVWRGCGLGQWMMVALMQAARERGATVATLEARRSNIVALHLYEKLGFETVGIRTHYYRDGEDALIMTLPQLDAPATEQRIRATQADAAARAARCFGDDG